MKTIEVGPLEFHDKIPLKKGYARTFKYFHEIDDDDEIINDFELRIAIVFD